MVSIFKQIKIIFGNIKKDKLNNLIIILFVGVSVFLMNFSLSIFMHWKYINNFVKDCGLYDNYMYFGYPSKQVGDDPEHGDFQRRIWEYEVSELERLKSEGVIEGWYATAQGGAPLSDDWENDRAPHIYYPKELAADLKFPVSKGIWFDKYDFEGADENVIPVVVGSDMAHRFKLGTKITLPFSEKPEKEYLVIGVLQRDTYLLAAGASGTDMDINYMFEQRNDAIIIIDDDTDDIFWHGHAIIKVPPENQQTVLDTFGDYSRTFSFKYMSDNAYEINRRNTEMFSVIFLLMMLVCIVCVSSGNLISTIANKKRYATFFLCGMDWNTSVITTVLESVLKLAIPGAVGYAIFMHQYNEPVSGLAIRITSANPIVTVVFLAAIFLLTSLIPLVEIKRTSPVKIIVDT